MDETYRFTESTDSAKQALDDIDDFESRLAGGAPKVKAAAGGGVHHTAPVKGRPSKDAPLVKGKAPRTPEEVPTEDQKERAADIKAVVSDLDDFDRRLGL